MQHEPTIMQYVCLVIGIGIWVAVFVGCILHSLRKERSV